MAQQKGLELPTSSMIIVAVVMLVLLVIGVFFISSSGTQINRAESERVFRQGCQELCKPIPLENYRTAAQLHITNPEFLAACTALGYGNAEYASRCLTQCGCDMRITYEDAQRQLLVLGTETGNPVYP